MHGYLFNAVEYTKYPCISPKQLVKFISVGSIVRYHNRKDAGVILLVLWYAIIAYCMCLCYQVDNLTTVGFVQYLSYEVKWVEVQWLRSRLVGVEWFWLGYGIYTVP